MKRQTLDLKNLLDIASSLYAVFWTKPSLITPTNDGLQSITEEQNLGANIDAFCCAFLDLFFLASSEAVEAHKGGVATLLTKIWDEHTRNQDLDPLVKKLWFANFTHLSIEIGVYSPFLSLYSLGKNVTFARSTNSSANERPLLLCA